MEGHRGWLNGHGRAQGKELWLQRRGRGTRAGAIWHVNKGSPVWEDWASSLVEGGQGVVV